MFCTFLSDKATRCIGLAVLSIGVIAGGAAEAQPVQQLNENCIVSVLNRNTRVRPDGSWVLPNIPANFGLVRARATCVFEGLTVSGESAPFLVLANQSVNVPPIQLGTTTPIPTSLELMANPGELVKLAQTGQVSVTARFGNGTTRNVTAGSTGTLYVISNPAIATITSDGLVTALASGTALVQATHEGTSGFTSIRVVLTADSDGDGIADDLELSLGLNPNNAADALEDRDRDGLNNRDETIAGTGLDTPDSDGDGLFDGEEVFVGADGFITNPLLADTDGDGVRDALEIATGSDPTNAANVNLGAALKALTVTPETFTITINSVQGEGFRQLTVTGVLGDGTTIDLTAGRGTNYQSDNLDVCNFGFPEGRVFGGQSGQCVITVSNSGHEDEAVATVTNFTPQPMGFVSIPGFANNVDVSGNMAYVAAGSAGLVLVNISNRAAPLVIATFDTPGNANDVQVLGNLAYVADGASGLRIIDVTNPAAPVTVGVFDTVGDAWDVVVSNRRAYVADGAAGLHILDVTNPAQPALLGSIDPAGTQKGVAVDPLRNLAVLASGTAGLHVIDVSNPSAPTQIGALPGGDVRDVALQNMHAFLADGQRSFTAVDLTIPGSPQLRGSTPQNLGGLLNDVVVQGNFALGADVVFVNGVPIIAIDAPDTPISRAILNFAGDFDGQGIAADAGYVYMTGVSGSAFTENGSNGTSRLFIGQYIAIQDLAGVAPTVAIVQPGAGTTVVEGTQLTVRATASDDIAVAAVTVLANGNAVFTDGSEPYEGLITAPQAPGPLVIGATAVDFGGNSATAATVTVNIIPDPLTTARGLVVDANQQPVAGATVTVLTFTTQTQADGSFVIPNLPTIQGALSARAVVVVNGVTLRGGTPAFVPVAGGFTEMGTIVVRRGGRLFGSSSVQGTNPGSIFTIDLETGVPTLVGKPANTPNGISDVSFNPVTGALYAMHGAATRGAELLTLDPATAVVLARVPMTSAVFISGSDAIAHNAGGVLYAGAWSSGRILTVNPLTGVAMTDRPVIGGGGNEHIADLAFDPTTGEMWGTRGGSHPGRIVRIDPATATVTRIIDVTGVGVFSPELTAIAFDTDGRMFVSVSGDRLGIVDKNTGVLTFVGTGFNGVKVSGLGFEQ
jgi:hypothetical protein